jgi:hypothetical protein
MTVWAFLKHGVCASPAYYFRHRRGFYMNLRSFVSYPADCRFLVFSGCLSPQTFMKRFMRLALGFSKKIENLEAAVNLHMAYYNFCWRPGKLRVTPAMAANVTGTLWSFDELLAK